MVLYLCCRCGPSDHYTLDREIRVPNATSRANVMVLRAAPRVPHLSIAPGSSLSLDFSNVSHHRRCLQGPHLQAPSQSTGGRAAPLHTVGLQEAPVLWRQKKNDTVRLLEALVPALP